MTSWGALREGLDAFVRRFPLLMGAWLVIAVAQRALYWVIPESLLLAQILLPSILLAPLYAGQYRLALMSVRREPVEFRELLSGFSRWRPLVCSYLFAVVLATLGMFLLIVPGIIAALAYSFTLIRFTDPEQKNGQIKAVEAMGESAAITRGYRGVLFGIGFLLLLPSIVLGVLYWMASTNPGFPWWILEIASLLSGSLFLGPVQATSFMVVYDHALKHPRG